MLLWGIGQPEKLMVEPCLEAAPGSTPVWWAVLAFLLPPISEGSLSKDANRRECCKSCYSGNCVAAQRTKGVGLTVLGTNIFVCSSPRAAGQFLDVLNTYCLEMPFSFHSLPSASHAERMKPHYAWKSDLNISLVACNYCLLLKLED